MNCGGGVSGEMVGGVWTPTLRVSIPKGMSIASKEVIDNKPDSTAIVIGL